MSFVSAALAVRARAAFRSRALLQGLLAASGAIAFAAIIVSFVAPAVAAVISPLFAGAAIESAHGASGSASTLAPAGISPSRIALALRFTLLEAFLSAVVAVLLGIPAAALVARRNFPGRRILLSLSGIPLCVPPVIIALAFVLFYGRQGYLNRALMSCFDLSEPPVTFLYSIAGVVIAHGFYNFPVVLRTVCVAWERLDERELEAASLLGAGRLRAWRTITLPRLSGAVLSSAALVFLYCFFSFVIVLLFGGVGGTTLEVELYQAARTSLDFRAAGTIALVETVAATLVVFLYSRALRASARSAGGLGAARPRKALSGPAERVLASAYLAFIAIFFVGPLASVVVRSLAVPSAAAFSSRTVIGLGAWASFFARPNFLPALARTLAVALSAATLAAAGALFFALALDRATGKLARLVRDAAPLLPLAVSSVALGFGWSLVSPRGNQAVLVLAEAAIAWPFAWTQIRASLDRIPRSARDAAALLSRSSLDARFRVLVPLVRKGILSGAGFVFAIAAGDATLPLVLSIRGFENLPLLLFRLSGSYRFSEACACATFLALLSAFAFFLQDAADRGEEVSR